MLMFHQCIVWIRSVIRATVITAVICPKSEFSRPVIQELSQKILTSPTLSPGKPTSSSNRTTVPLPSSTNGWTRTPSTLLPSHAQLRRTGPHYLCQSPSRSLCSDASSTSTNIPGPGSRRFARWSIAFLVHWLGTSTRFNPRLTSGSGMFELLII